MYIINFPEKNTSIILTPRCKRPHKRFLYATVGLREHNANHREKFHTVGMGHHVREQQTEIPRGAGELPGAHRPFKSEKYTCR